MNLLLVLRALAIATAIVCAVLSLVTAAPLGARFRTVWRLAVLAAIGLQLGVEIDNVLGRRARWTKLLLPLVGIVAIVHAFATRGLPVVSIGIAFALEVGVIVFALVLVVRAIRGAPQSYPEDILECELEKFSPGPLNRFMVAEMTIVVSALAYLFGGCVRPLPAGFSYVRTWSSVPLIMAFPAMVLPEALAIDFLLAQMHVFWGWRLANDVLHVYGLLWVIGILASARLRPHRTDAVSVRFRFGALRKIDVARANIAGMRVFGPVVDRRAFLRSFPRATTLGMVLDGAPALEVAFHDPIAVRGMFGGKRAVDRVVVAVDEPHALVAALA